MRARRMEELALHPTVKPVKMLPLPSRMYQGGVIFSFRFLNRVVVSLVAAFLAKG